MKTPIFITALLSSMVFTSPTFAAPAPVTIQEITAAGDACPEGSVSITIAPDQRSFSVLFDQAVVQSTTTSPIENRTCELTLVSNVTAGWKFNLHQSDYRGFSQVDPGSQTFQRTSYYVLSPKNKWMLLRQSKKQFNATFNDNYLISHNFKTPQSHKLQAKDHLETVKIQIQLVSRSNQKKATSSQLALDSFDGTVEGIKQVTSCD